MTAKTAATVSSDLSIKQLRIAPWNARKTFDQSSVAELAESIRQHGMLVKLIVRPLDNMADILRDPVEAANSVSAFEIVAGYRRLKAAQLAGLTALPCEIRELTDDQAREIGLIDNLQREDVPAMEEAVAFSELFTSLGSIEAIAARLQKDHGYIAKRLKLCTLSLAGQDALKHRLITVDHAMVLARLGADEQDAALKWCLDRNAGAKVGVDKVIEDRVKRQQEAARELLDEPNSHRWRHTWEPQSVQELKDHIASESGVPLSRAPWDLDTDVLIPDAVVCNACQQNTTANAPLFGDLQIGEAKCTDTGCFKEKTAELVQIRQKEAAAHQHAGQQVLRVSWKSTSTPPRMEKDGGGPSLNQTFKDGQWIEVKKKSCEHVRAAVTVDWSDANNRGYMDGEKKLRKPGEILQICIEPKCKVHPKGYAKTKSASDAGSAPRNENSPEARAEREKREAEAKAENEIRTTHLRAALDKVQKLPGEVLRRLLLQLLGDWQIENDADEHFPGLKKVLEKSDPESAQFVRSACSLLFCGDEAYELWADDDSSAARGRKEFIATLKLFGYDASKAWEKPKADKSAKPAKPAKAPAKKPAKKAAKKAGKR